MLIYEMTPGRFEIKYVSWCFANQNIVNSDFRYSFTGNF